MNFLQVEPNLFWYFFITSLIMDFVLRGHVPYRDSKLTRILQPALGGNSNTAIICNITLAQVCHLIICYQLSSHVVWTIGLWKQKHVLLMSFLQNCILKYELLKHLLLCLLIDVALWKLVKGDTDLSFIFFFHI